jgi:DNA-binding GntR family transcriptional regulator
MSQMASIYDQLRDEILSLVMSPGERFTERALEARFEISRTPIRAALAKLETDGLVARDDRSWVVTPISLEELEQAIAFREVVETAVVKLACKHADPSDIDLVKEIIVSCTGDSPRCDWHRVGLDFHIELARLTGNAFYVRAVQDLMIRLCRARWLEVWTVEGQERSKSEHLHILDCIRGRQVQAAETAVRKHIQGVKARSIGKQLTDGVRGKIRGFAVVRGGR